MCEMVNYGKFVFKNRFCVTLSYKTSIHNAESRKLIYFAFVRFRELQILFERKSLL